MEVEIEVEMEMEIEVERVRARLRSRYIVLCYFSPEIDTGHCSLNRQQNTHFTKVSGNRRARSSRAPGLNQWSPLPQATYSPYELPESLLRAGYPQRA